MLYNIILLGFLACGDETTKTEEAIPTPPTDVKKEEVKKEEVKTEEVKTEEVKTETVATEEVKTEAAPSEGTKPTVKTEDKLMTTKEIEAPQSKLLADKVEKQLLADAKSKGFDGIKDFKLVKNECKAGGTCKGIGQATAYKTVVTYAVGNAVTVTQADKTTKNGLITAIENDKYTVSYDDNSNATVELSALSPR